MKSFFILILSTLISSQAFANLFDGKWYGTNPCAYFDESQDVVLEIEDGKAKVDWGEKHNLTKKSIEHKKTPALFGGGVFVI